MRNLITDIRGIRVGNAHDAAAATGVTAILFDRPTTASAASTAWPETLSTTHTRTVPLPPAATNTPGIRSVPLAVQGTSAVTPGLRVPQPVFVATRSE